jgi:hypothetical protein
MKFVVVNFCVRQNALWRKIADAWVGRLSAGGDLSAAKAGTYFILTLSRLSRWIEPLAGVQSDGASSA